MAEILKKLTWALVFLGASAALGVTSGELSAVLSVPPGRFAKINIGAGIVYDTTQFEYLYRERNFEPLWHNSTGFTPRTRVVRELLQSSYRHGLISDSFWSAPMEKFYMQGKGLKPLDFELALSEATLRYVRVLHIGQIDPMLVDDDIKVPRKLMSESQLTLLRQILQGEPELISSEIEKFEPQIPLYRHLKKQLENRSSEFTKDQTNKIRATMEKLRWLPNSLGERYAFVNLAMTELRVVENDETVLSMKTVNGRPIRRTPMLVDVMKKVEVNPTWIVPLNLAIWDKLPKIKKDVGFLSRNHIRVFQSGSFNPIEDVESIPWNALNRYNFPYILQQDAGPVNVLGKVKFPLTNGNSIYLHDTDERFLFSEAAPRLRSSGCIRLAKPMEMAAYLLKNQIVPPDKGWLFKDGSAVPEGTTFTEEILMSRVVKVQDTSAGVSTIPILVENPLPIYTAYLTADMDDKGGVRFIRDHYKQDARLLAILKTAGDGTPQKVPRVNVPDRARVPVIISGSLGPTQLFGQVVAVRCAVWPYKGCIETSGYGDVIREEYKFKVNELVSLPEGHYILAVENSMLPGWLEVQCKDSGAGQSPCSTVTVNLERINIPDEFAEADEVFVYRDLTASVEQNKILSQSFHNGRPLIKETPVSAKNFYLPGANQFDVVQHLNNDYCDTILTGQVFGVAPEVQKYCEGLSQVVGMAEYMDLPVVVDNEVNTSRTMKVFQFPKRGDPLGQASARWSQRWVGSPGNWIDFTHRRYLVAAPIFPKNINAENRFVAVLPGQYRILGVDREGNAIGQTMIRTQNIDENYIRIARKVLLGP